MRKNRSLVEMGVSSHNRGDHQSSRIYFVSAIKQNRYNESAWIGLHNVCKINKNRIYCLEQIIRINPQNEFAKKMLLDSGNQPFNHNYQISTSLTLLEIDLDILLAREAESNQKLAKEFSKKIIELEKNILWQEIITVCTEWLEIADNNLEALKHISRANSLLGNIEESNRHCNIALSILPSESPARIFFEEILKSNIAINKSTSISDLDVVELENKLSLILTNFDFSLAKQISKNCCDEITKMRHYEVPPNGRIELLTTDKIRNLLKIEKVKFIQEGYSAPEVLVVLEFCDSKFGELKINNDGSTSGFHENYEILNAIISALSLTYYRDIVVPIYFSVHAVRKGVKKTNITIYAVTAPKLKRNYIYRRYFQDYIHINQVQDFATWHIIQNRLKHNVIGHLRWVGNNYKAPKMKQEQSKQAGITLPIGYTWVVGHERGEQKNEMTDEYHLSQIICFHPPSRAENDLNKLLL